MKLHTANKYLLSLPRVAEKGLGARFRALQEAAFAAFGIDRAVSVLLTVSGDEHSYVCRAVTAAFAHTGQSVAIVSLDPDASAAEIVKLGGNNASDDEAAHVVTVIRQSAASLGITPTVIEAKLLCGLALCALKGCKNVILGFEPTRVPRAFYDIVPLSRTVALLPSAVSVSDSAAIVRKGVLEVISSPRGEDEYRAISAVCASVNCRHSVISRSAVAASALTYKGIEFSYKERKYAMRGHSESMITAALSAVLAACALERRGVKISESDVRATLPDVSVEHGCRIVSYNPCVLVAVCRNGESFARLDADVERVCAHLGKIPRSFSALDDTAELESAFSACQDGECALCVKGDAGFVEKTLNTLAKWISPPVK